MPPTVGLQGRAERVVGEADTAIALGSGDVPVFGTPALAALMEAAAVDAVASSLEAGATSVGTRLELDHLKPSRVGATVHAHAQVTAVDGRMLTFQITAHDGDAVIGRCVHTRAVVDRARFA